MQAMQQSTPLYNLSMLIIRIGRKVSNNTVDAEALEKRRIENEKRRLRV